MGLMSSRLSSPESLAIDTTARISRDRIVLIKLRAIAESALICILVMLVNAAIACTSPVGSRVKNHTLHGRINDRVVRFE